MKINAMTATATASSKTNIAIGVLSPVFTDFAEDVCEFAGVTELVGVGVEVISVSSTV